MIIVNVMSTNEKREKKRFSTFRIVGGYLLFGVLWIIFSDNVLMMISPNPQFYQELQTYKGLFYVVATAVLLLGLVKREFRIRDAIQIQLENSLEIRAELSRELHHRVKNNLQLIRSLLNLQREKVRASKKPPEANELLKHVAMRIMVPTLFHQKIHSLHEKSLVPLDFYLGEIVSQFNREYETELSEQSIRTELAQMSVRANQAVPIGVIVSELLMNVVLHGFPQGNNVPEVLVRGQERSGFLVLSVEDNGVGFDQDTIRKGLGYTLIDAMLTQLDGEIRFSSDHKNLVEITIATSQAEDAEVETG